MPAAEPSPRLRLLGVDFSSRPDRRKPIVVAEGHRCDASGRLRLDRLRALSDPADFSCLLTEPGP